MFVLSFFSVFFFLACKLFPYPFWLCVLLSTDFFSYVFSHPHSFTFLMIRHLLLTNNTSTIPISSNGDSTVVTVAVKQYGATFLSDARRPEVDFLHSLSRDFKHIFRQIVSIRVKTLSNTNLVASRQIKIEKTSLRVDKRRTKMSLLKLPNRLI